MFNRLNNPEIGPQRPDIAENCRYLPEQSHLIFYHIDNDSVVILVIPHSSMDIKKHVEQKEG
ncbi:MAG: type II toxin-antitoxin system RelE/ParE family toxin [Pseudomonadales bacterium]|nr:type II toxin-antitoxin system RelE/ParE family toxin [Pseudomonadales bacterium]